VTDYTILNKNKHQIYISGEVHGDEKVGPTASIELIKLLLNNKDKNPWFKFLLQTRYIVITPMTNPFGYDKHFREELIEDKISEEIHKLQPGSHRDINRDFPYLVDQSKCMETIGARLVNELFINHMFSLALTLHGGTESLTYPYGAPNHIKSSPYQIDMQYSKNEKGETISREGGNAKNISDKFKNGQIGGMGLSTEAPDFQAASSKNNHI
jgi:predicted deacylase